MNNEREMKYNNNNGQNKKTFYIFSIFFFHLFFLSVCKHVWILYMFILLTLSLTPTFHHFTTLCDSASVQLCCYIFIYIVAPMFMYIQIMYASTRMSHQQTVKNFFNIALTCDSQHSVCVKAANAWHKHT